MTKKSNKIVAKPSIHVSPFKKDSKNSKVKAKGIHSPSKLPEKIENENRNTIKVDKTGSKLKIKSKFMLLNHYREAKTC